jgi:hypothetical protein
MDNSTHLGMDDPFGHIFGGPSRCTFGALLGLLGTDKAGTKRCILVLRNSRCDLDFGVAGSEDIRRIRRPDRGGWFHLASGGLIRSPN